MANIPELEQYRTLMAEKAAAKALALAATGQAIWNEANGKASDKEWAVVSEQGNATGVEGVKAAEARALADRLVAEHPEYFTILEGKEHDECVSLVSAFRTANLIDDATLVSIYIMAKWEPLHVGGSVKARVRLPGGK